MAASAAALWSLVKFKIIKNKKWRWFLFADYNERCTFVMHHKVWWEAIELCGFYELKKSNVASMNFFSMHYE